MNTTEIYIVLVNWNKPLMTLDCIKSIKKSIYTNYKILVVENGSNDNSVELLNNNNDFHLIISNKNLGYTGGNNIAIKYCLEHNTNYIFLLNNDTILSPDAIGILLNSAKKDNRIGIIQPKIFFYPETDKLWCGPTSFNKLLITSRLLGNGKFDSIKYNQTQELPFSVGCATFIKTEVFNSIGLLDDDFFAVCEDVDFGIRAIKANYKIIYEPKSIIYHLESVSAGGINNYYYVFLQTRSQILLINKHAFNKLHLVLAITIYLLRAHYRASKLFMTGNFNSANSIIIAFRNYFTFNIKTLKR
jgi:GT2 family glycosyltransferase